MDDEKLNLALRLFEAGAVKVGVRQRISIHDHHPELPPSPIYFEIRTPRHPTRPGPVNQRLLDEMGLQVAEMTHSRVPNFSEVYGIPSAGTPLAEVFAKHYDNLNRFLWPRKKSKEILVLGEENPEGERGASLVLVDDVIGAATTKVKEIEKWQKHKRIAAILTVVDREEGGREMIRARYGIPSFSLLRLGWMLDVWLAAKKITRTQYDEVREFQRVLYALNPPSRL